MVEIIFISDKFQPSFKMLTTLSHNNVIPTLYPLITWPLFRPSSSTSGASQPRSKASLFTQRKTRRFFGADSRPKNKIIHSNVLTIKRQEGKCVNNRVEITEMSIFKVQTVGRKKFIRTYTGD